MTEEKRGAEEKKGAKEKVSDGIKQGIGVLSAFRDALEETIQEARERGDLSTERAREVIKEVLEKAQSAAEGAKERLDLVTQKEFDGLGRAVDVIKERVSVLEGHLGFGRGDAEHSETAEADDNAPDSATDARVDDGAELREDADGASG